MNSAIAKSVVPRDSIVIVTDSIWSMIIETKSKFEAKENDVDANFAKVLLSR